MSKDTGQFLFLSLMVALLAGLAFLPGLPGDFVFDDHPNIVSNTSIQMERLDADALAKAITTPQISGSMRGLPTLTFALDYWRGGGTADPATFKTTNIIIHALTALALAWLFRSLLLMAGISAARVRWLAPAFALAWALHPLHVSSVLYAVQRLQTMGTLFLVLALLAYLKARQAQMEGRPGRTGMLLTLLLWALALACKEDSALLPAYTLALELTVLRFRAADAKLVIFLRRGYLFATMAGAVAFLFWFAPRYWHWEAYPGRDFSTWERLLTQARVLCMYLWQILLPLPRNMPFYYDWLQPSRGLLQPWTTLPAIALLLALLGTAWRLRKRLPLFTLGVLLFFAAHFITANVIGLELAFEHRNHFALIGAILAVGALLDAASLRWRIRPALQATLGAGLLVALGTATLIRAQSWNSTLALAQTSARLAPHSARAWISLCAGLYEAGGGAVADNPRLDEAIAACSSGAELAPNSLNNPALLIALKTLRGDVTQQDWDFFQRRLETVQMSWDNGRAPSILTHNYREGVKLDKQPLLKVIATLVERIGSDMKPFSLASLGYFVMNDLEEPDLAMPYFIQVIKTSPLNDPFPHQLGGELRAIDRPDLAETIEQLGLDRLRNADTQADVDKR